MSVLWRIEGIAVTSLATMCKVICNTICNTICNFTCNTFLKGIFMATSMCLLAASAAAGAATPHPLSAEQVRSGFKVAQACEVEIDDDLTSYGECIGHAADRLAGQRLALLGLNFQAWMMADLAARQGSTRSLLLRTRYQRALEKSLRANRWAVKQLCEVKQLACGPIELRLTQKL